MGKRGYFYTNLCKLLNLDQRLYNAPASNNYIQTQAKLEEKAYQFDKIFNSKSSQEEVFEQLQISYLVKKVIEGFNSTIFVYGQTGSGKTYTMEGYEYTIAEEFYQNPAIQPIITDDQNIGIAIRTIREFFKQREKIKGHLRDRFNFYVSFFQIYNEKVYDLLNFENTDKSPSQTVSSHKMNHASSRSHCIFSIQVDQASQPYDEEGDNSNYQVLTSSKMFLVDLAGSERISLLGQTDKVSQKETIGINKSLMILRKCIGALESNTQSQKDTKHIPYRESRLTQVLKQSLGGNSYCLMIACISPSDKNYDENIQTLNYAMKTNNIRNTPVRNLDQSQLLKLQMQTRNQQQQLAQKSVNNRRLQHNRDKSQTSVTSQRDNLNSSFYKLPSFDYLGQGNTVNQRNQNYQNLIQKQQSNNTQNNDTKSRYNQRSIIKEIQLAIENGGQLSSTTINLLQQLLEKNKQMKNLKDSLDQTQNNTGVINEYEQQMKQLKNENMDLRMKLTKSYKQNSLLKQANSNIDTDDQQQLQMEINDRRINSSEIQNYYSQLPLLSKSLIDSQEQSKSNKSQFSIKKQTLIKLSKTPGISSTKHELNNNDYRMSQGLSKIQREYLSSKKLQNPKDFQQFQELQDQIKKNSDEIRSLRNYLKSSLNKTQENIPQLSLSDTRESQSATRQDPMFADYSPAKSKIDLKKIKIASRNKPDQLDQTKTQQFSSFIQNQSFYGQIGEFGSRKTFDNTSLLRNQLNKQPPIFYIANMPIGAKSLFFKNYNLNLNQIDSRQTHHQWQQFQDQTNQNQQQNGNQSNLQNESHFKQPRQSVNISKQSNQIQSNDINKQANNQQKEFDLGLLKDYDPYRIHSGPVLVNQNQQKNIKQENIKDSEGLLMKASKNIKSKINEDFQTR
eukprot:403340759